MEEKSSVVTESTEESVEEERKNVLLAKAVGPRDASAKRMGVGDAYDVDLMLLRRGTKKSTWIDPGPEHASFTRLKKITVSHSDYELIISELEGTKYGSGCRPELDLQLIGRTEPETPPPEEASDGDDGEDEGAGEDKDTGSGEDDDDDGDDGEDDDGDDGDDDGEGKEGGDTEGEGTEGMGGGKKHKKKELGKKAAAAKKKADAKAEAKRRKAQLRSEAKARAKERAEAREKRRMEEQEMRKNIAERVKNCKAQDDSAGKGIKVLFDTNREAYIVSAFIEDQITLMLRDAGETVLFLSKAYVRYKDHLDVPVNSPMRARLWRRFVREYIRPHLKSFDYSKAMEKRYKDQMTTRLEEELMSFEKEWAAEELSSTDDSDEEEGRGDRGGGKKRMSAAQKKKAVKKEKKRLEKEALEKAKFEANVSGSVASGG